MNYLRLLQLRRMAADGAGGGTDKGADSGVGDDKGKGDADSGTDKGKDEPRTFTQAELDAIIERRIARAQAKWEKDTAEKIKAAQSEAEKMAKMTAEQRAEAERQKRESELAAREAEITRRELRAQALETLAAEGLPKGLADVLDYTDAEKCTASIEAVKKAFQSAVEAAVNARLRGDPPKSGDPGKPVSPATLGEAVEQAIKNQTKKG